MLVQIGQTNNSPKIGSKTLVLSLNFYEIENKPIAAISIPR